MPHEGVHVGLGLSSELTGVYCKGQEGNFNEQKEQDSKKIPVSTLINAN